VASGHGCWGILNGPATGKAIAELLMDGKTTSLDLSLFDVSSQRHNGELEYYSIDCAYLINEIKYAK
jgi:hypothetical protein